jgi:DnaA family protein
MFGAQLSLSMGLDDSATFDNFFIGGNKTIVDALQSFLIHKQERFIYLCGPYGCGLSHLLQATCNFRQQNNERAMYLPLAQGEFTPAILEGIESLSLVCLDDIDSVIGIREWDEALFHLYNRMQNTTSQLLVSAKQLPSQLKNCLPDLRSRLCWGLVFQVTTLTDAEKYASLQLRAKIRGFELSDEVCKFLLRHYPRDTHVLYNLLNLLDSTSLEARRKITIPFVKEVMANARIAGVA